MIYKVGILGATGRMGTEISNLLFGGYALGENHFELVDVVGRSGRIQSIEGMEVRTLKEPAREPCHVWIDFSRPDATLQLLDQIDTPVVIGTTGFTAEEHRRIRDYAESRPVLLNSNSSPGMNALFAWLRRLPKLEGFDVVLSEEHHRNKKDAPSGTALSLAEVLKSTGHEPSQIESLRAGGTRGVHTIRFVAPNEEIEITHRVSDRRVFAEGALLAASFLLQQKQPGIYSMENLYA